LIIIVSSVHCPDLVLPDSSSGFHSGTVLELTYFRLNALLLHYCPDLSRASYYFSSTCLLTAVAISLAAGTLLRQST
jgi:hypothetical protein